MGTKLKTLRDINIDDVDLFNIEETDTDEEPKEWTVITALERVLSKSNDSQLDSKLWDILQSPLAFLREKLQLTNMQIVFLSMLADSDTPMTWKDFSDHLDCSRLKVMAFSDDIEDLFKKQWITHRIGFRHGIRFKAFALEQGVIKALRLNEPFKPKKMEDLTLQEFVDCLSFRVEMGMKSNEMLFEDEEHWMMNLVEANPQLPLCAWISKIECNIHDKSLMLLIIADYAQYCGMEMEGLSFGTIDDIYPNDFHCSTMRRMLVDGIHPLMDLGYIEQKCEDGQANPRIYVLTAKFKDEYLAGYTTRNASNSDKLIKRELKSHDSIREKELFFNASEENRLDNLTQMLQKDQLAHIQQRLEESGMRRGVACLFYGAPGTGKTEMVLQMARRTGRDIMQVDIASMRDKFVGESEKNLKRIFQRYRTICKNCDVMPILFFNEADAIINKRTENVEHSVDKMENAMQNILLQELEDFDGILIATTNLTSNLDNAFERRFLFKIEFHKPDVAVKARIWTSMIKTLSAEDATMLASRYDFSGGQIENVARKNTINFIMSGQASTLNELDKYCREETFTGKHGHRVMGFMA